MNEVIRKLRKAAPVVFDATPVIFAYLYGSHASGTSGPRSDVDVAVYLEDGSDGTLELSLRLAGVLERESSVAPVGALLVLNSAPIAIAGRVIEEGHVIYSRDETRRVRHASETLRHYHDFKIHDLRAARLRLARIAGGG
ncbi:MAG: nucleotidyltransferase domain-containing protein [Actinobacteria bacterium]|nr:nucleotidyltransferase domain-containing protein [Actinomycetota bacterium]